MNITEKYAPPRHERIAELTWAPQLSYLNNCCCGAAAGPVVAWRDRYGFAAEIVKCLECGTVFAGRTMQRRAIREFYASGLYRKLVSAYHGHDVMRTIECEQLDYAKRLEECLAPRIRPGRHLLDVGGSTGVIAKHFADTFSVDVTVLDPALEITAPRLHHLQYTAEEFDNPFYYRWQTILLCQTIDHLLDPAGVLKKLRTWLSTAAGVLFVDILDFEREVLEKGVDNTLKVDHLFYFTDQTARRLLERCGFRVVDSWESAKNHIGYLCEGNA